MNLLDLTIIFILFDKKTCQHFSGTIKTCSSWFIDS